MSAGNQTSGSAAGPLRSEFANDPDMAEIVEMFVDEMPQRTEQLTKLWSSQQMEDLKRFAHQIKGASGGYGFPTVGAAAAKVESTLNALSEGSATASLQDLRKQVEDLINLCQRVTR
jgi:HPt (histidine-containing phosphotransfer) domain-containing protein